MKQIQIPIFRRDFSLSILQYFRRQGIDLRNPKPKGESDE